MTHKSRCNKCRAPLRTALRGSICEMCWRAAHSTTSSSRPRSATLSESRQYAPESLAEYWGYTAPDDAPDSDPEPLWPPRGYRAA